MTEAVSKISAEEAQQELNKCPAHAEGAAHASEGTPVKKKSAHSLSSTPTSRPWPPTVVGNGSICIAAFSFVFLKKSSQKSSLSSLCVCVCVCVCVCPLICVFVLLQSTNGTTSTCRSERGFNFLLESEEFFGRQVTTGRKQLRRPCGSHESSGTDGVLQKKKEPKKGKKKESKSGSPVCAAVPSVNTHTHTRRWTSSLFFFFLRLVFLQLLGGRGAPRTTFQDSLTLSAYETRPIYNVE